MADSHLVSGLRNLRAEKLGKLQQLKKEIDRLVSEATEVEGMIEHVDAVLKDVAPDTDLEAIKPVRARQPEARGGVPRLHSDGRLPVTQQVLRVLREESIPMTADEVIACVARHHRDKDERKLANNVRVFLSLKTREGLLVANDTADGRKRYAINR